MGVLSSVRAVRWARKHQPDQVSHWIALAHERFPPDDLLRQAVEAEQAGFDGICCSDHLAPWWTDETAPTNSGSAWVWLGAAAHATDHAKLGSAVTAIVHRYNPVVVDQNAATLEFLAPGRAFLGGRLGRGDERGACRDGMAFAGRAARAHGGGPKGASSTRCRDGACPCTCPPSTKAPPSWRGDSRTASGCSAIRSRRRSSLRRTA